MSLFNHLIHLQDENKIQLNKCVFIWSVKEAPMLSKMKLSQKYANVSIAVKPSTEVVVDLNANFGVLPTVDDILN